MMTNAKISKKARLILKNKELSSAIARQLVTDAHTVAREGINVKTNTGQVRVRIASSHNR